MKELIYKYAPALVVIGILLFIVTYWLENFINQGFMIRLGHYYNPFTEPFPQGQYTVLLYSLSLSGIVIAIIGFIFGKKGSE